MAIRTTMGLVKPMMPKNDSPTMVRTSIVVTSTGTPTETLEEVLDHVNQPGLLRELKLIVKTLKVITKKPTKKNSVIMVAGLIAIILWAWSKYSPSYNYMMPTGLKGIVAVLTASFTNVPARILHFSALTTLITAYGPELMKGKPNKLIGNFKTAFRQVKRIVGLRSGARFSVAVIAFGVGLFFSNFLMRNNAQNKYLVCLTLGLTVLLSSGGLFKSTFIKLIKGAYRDIGRLLNKSTQMNNYLLSIQVGFGSGLVLSYINCLMRSIVYASFTENMGYILGSLMVIAGIVLFLAGDKGQKVVTNG